MSVPAQAEFLFRNLFISEEGQYKLLAPFGDTFPTTEQQLRSMLTSIRRVGHTRERIRGTSAASTPGVLARAAYHSIAPGHDPFFLACPDEEPELVGVGAQSWR